MVEKCALSFLVIREVPSAIFEEIETDDLLI